MPPIPIYSHSPINAAKAADATPQTAAEKATQNAPHNSSPPATTTAAAAAAQGYPPAQPGASPFLPAPTVPNAQSQYYPPIQPTPTQALPGSQGPPPPQPGAFPVPPGGGPPTATAKARATSTLPPSPRAGETTAAAPHVPPMSAYPPQMRIPPPSGTTPVQAAQRGTLTTSSATGPNPTNTNAATTSAFEAGPSPLEHPPGYQQNAYAGEMDRYQRARQDALDAEERSRSGSLVGGGDGAAGERVWDSAKKALMAAGEKLAGAENEVWKRINKG